MRKFLVTFTTPSSNGQYLKETVEGSDWSHAKAKMESRYAGIRISSYNYVQ